MPTWTDCTAGSRRRSCERPGAPPDARPFGSRAISLDPAPPPPSTRPLRTRRRLWAFRGLTLAGAALALGGCEVALRLAGFGQSYRLVIPVPVASEKLKFQLNPEIDRVYFGARDMFGPEGRRFDLPKPPNTFRILFLGASTVHGFPYTPEIAFPRQVEHLLEAQQPGVDVEVLNAGVTAINSFEIADLAGECAAAEPDLVVIHSGHNEFFGPGGPGSSVLPLPPELIELTFCVRRTRIGQAVAALQPAPVSDVRNPLESLPRLTEIRHTDPEFTAALTNYRRNLTRAVDRLRAAEIPVLLTTVAGNLKDQAPIRPLWSADWNEAERQQAHSQLTGAEQLLQAGRPAEAREALEAMPLTARQSAQWQYRWAQSLEATGEAAAALEAYELARDYDGCRFRAPRACGEIVRSIAVEANNPGVRLLDLEAVVREAAQGAAPGHDLYLEHVHYNLTGHRLLARSLARAIQTDVRESSWSAELDLTDAALDAAIGLLPEDALAGASFALEAVQTQPLGGALDASRVQNWLRDVIRRDYAALSPERARAFGEVSLHDLQHALVPALARRHAAAGQHEFALELAAVGTQRRPWDAEAWLLLARARWSRGDSQGALAACDEALRIDPNSIDAQNFRESVAAASEVP